MSNSSKAIVKDNILITIDEEHITVGSSAWYEWLLSAKRFSYKSPQGSFVAQCEQRRNKPYWYAYRRAGTLRKVYLGKAEELTPERLDQAIVALTGQTLFQQRADPVAGGENHTPESRIDTSFIPLTKVNVPALPRQLVSRPRLTRRINTPLTVIHAPSGFGKSTLLNDWTQSCGHAVAWISLDESDNDLVRFWYSVTMALQTVDPNLGKELLVYLTSASPIQPHEVVSRLTNDIVRHQESFSRLGLVLDDFHCVHRAEIYDSIQSWIEHLPSNMQLIILGHTNPPLALGDMRARGLLTEMDAHDLRFTVEEGVAYLRQYQPETSLAYDDLAKLVKHTEGWAAGLTLTALALGKQHDHRQFVDTFSGAHIYMRDYFMETVLQRSSPEVQTFLLKTAILKHLTGSLCEAVTDQSGGDEMLSHLWQENLFIVRLEEQGWYRYHDLFSEMLLSQLQMRFPNEIALLHKRAAQWYRSQYAPADAIYHLLAIEAWEEAAFLIEEMALRELEQFGEDSRLLRWLQELPANVVQRHKTLLLVYLRLAQVALPRQKIEQFIGHIQVNLSGKPVSQQTQDERDVLREIQAIQSAWAQNDEFPLPLREGSDNDAKWELLNGMQLLSQTYDHDTDMLEGQIADLLHKAQSQRNLFVTLMAGGILARRLFISGQLRRSEKLARQILEQALAQRGKLPEPASITLATLSQIYLERNDLALAQRYLAQAMEVDPNPASTNMLVQIAFQRIEANIAQGDFEEALANSRSVRELHLRRPSGLWTDQYLLAYEAFIYVRMGNASDAERILNSITDTQENDLAQLVRAETLMLQNRATAAEEQLSALQKKYPNGILSVPLLRVHLLFAKVLIDQHKVNQAVQMMKDALRLAAPEHFFRPFLEGNTRCLPLLSLIMQTENLSQDVAAFVREVLRLSNFAGSGMPVSQAEIKALSTSASISLREQEVLRLIGAGCSNRDMATRLSISESTVKTHVGNIYQKLNVKSRVQAITYAKELKLL